MIRVAICDDEPDFIKLFQNELERTLKQLDIKHVITCYSSGRKFLKELENFDAVFLDIDMPEMNGMEIARYINKIHPIPILFLTAYNELVYSSIRFQPFRFIRKDHLDSELEEAVFALNEYIHIQFQKHSVCLHTPNGDLAMSIGEIKYAEIYGHWIKIHTKGKKVFNCYGSLKDFEEQWEKYDFVRTHKSYLVNARYIYSIRKDTVILEDGEEVILSRSKTQDVMNKFEMIMRSV